MKSDEIYNIIKDQAILKCGDLWQVMNTNEQNTAMLKMAITFIKELSKKDEE